MFDPQDGTCFFATEGALQFRYARLVASGERIPDHDSLVQAPEGIRPREVLCLLLENCAGQSYRALAGLWGKPPVHVWCAFFPHVVAGLGTIAAFLAARVVWQSLAAGVVAAALYAFSLATTARSLGAFGHEDFALPGIFFAVACLLEIAAADSRRKVALFGAGLALSVVWALGAWHFSRFALALVAGSLGVAAVLGSKEERSRLVYGAGFLALGAVMAVALFPVLRPHPAGEESAFGHVFALLAAKLRFLNRKPLDPSLLSPEARSLWIEDFDGPSLFLSILMFAVPAALAFWALIRLWRRDGAGPQASHAGMRARLSDIPTGRRAPFLLLLALLLLSGASYFLVKRLFVLFVFPLAVTAGGAALAAIPGSWDALSRSGRRFGRKSSAAESKKGSASSDGGGSFGAAQIGAAVVLLAALSFEAHKVQSFGGETPASRALRRLLPVEDVVVLPHWQLNERVIVDWILRHTKPNDVFVGRVSTSAVILADAGRPVVLHPKYEVPGVRERSREFSHALYDSEEALAAFCLKHGARYYLHEPRLALEAGDDSERYVGAALPLSKRSAAFRLQFAAQESEHFRLVMRNSSFALFEVLGEGEEGGERAGAAASIPVPLADAGGPLYDLVAFGGQTLEGESFDDAHTKPVVVQLQEAVDFYTRGRVALAAHRFDAAIPAFEEALRRYPTLLGLNTSYGIALARKGDFHAGLPLCLREVAISPDLALAHSNLGYILGNLGDYAAALQHFDRAIELSPDDPGARAMRAQVAEVARVAKESEGAR